MNLQDLGAIGDLIGGIGVVISLIYVAHQIRQNSRQIAQNTLHMEASMYHATNDAFCNWYALLAQDGDLATLWRRALDDEVLESDEKARVYALIAMLFITFENNFQQLRLGAVRRNTLKIASSALSALMARPVVRAWWNREGAWVLMPEFRMAVEDLVSEASVSTDTAQPS